MSFKVCAFLSSMMKSYATLLCPTQGTNHPFVQHLHSVYDTCPLVTY